jgi:filamentous hemagglutinin
VTDGETVLTNLSGESVGVDGDGVKLGGTRIDLDRLCGTKNERCTTYPDGHLELDEFGRVQFDPDKAGMSLIAFLESDKGKQMGGLTGGVQGMQGTFANIPYVKGGIIDKLFEAFAGPHDMIGGQWAGLYDEQGNAVRGRSWMLQQGHNAWTVTAIAPAAPFAMAKVLPPDVWQAITILVRGLK